MAEPRKVPFVTISSFITSSSPTPSPSESNVKKRRREDEAEITCLVKDGGGGTTTAAAAAAAGGSGGGGGGGGIGGPFGGDAAGEPEETKPTVRLNLSLTEPSDRGSAEFNYSELVYPLTPQVNPPPPVATVPKGLTPALDPSDPFADDDRERREVEALAKKFENKYGGVPKKKKKDRMQDLIDIGYGYDETDPFIDNSEAYDELVPASLTTKHGGFYINTGTLQFRPASDSEGDDFSMEGNYFKKVKDGEERVIKKRKKKQDGINMEDKKPRKNRMPKQGGMVLNVHRPEKKKRKKLMKDSIHLANMLRRFTREKAEIRKKSPAPAPAPAVLPRPGGPKAPNAAANNNSSALLNAHAHPKTAAGGGNEFNMTDLTSDPNMDWLMGSANNNNDMLQDMMGDLDFGMLDSPQPSSPAQGGENGLAGAQHNKAMAGRVSQGGVGVVLSPPPLPAGLPAPLTKRIEDLRAASRQFDEEGRKKFFTLDMNNILLDIELQVQEQPAAVRAVVYSHLEAFVPCNKEALLKRLKKLSLNIQDDRLRTPLLKLKLAVCSVMPEQIARFNMDCIAKVAKQQSEEGEKNGSEEEDEEKPGKRVMGPRKKFIWDDKLRSLLCNLVRVKLGCYELEGQSSLSLEDYLKAFMETEVKPLWPKGWMQARMLFKESIMAHGHLTGNTAKKKMIPSTPKGLKPKESGWVQQRTTPSSVVGGATLSPAGGQVARRPPQSPSEPICVDSLDDDLAAVAPSLDSISQALAILSNAAKGLAHGDGPPSPDGPKAVPAAAPSSSSSSLHSSSPLLQQQHKKGSVGTTPGSTAPHYVSTSSSPSSNNSLSRPLSSVSSSSPLVAGLGVMKAGVGVAHRHSPFNAQRPGVVTAVKAGGSPSPQPKPRPPPTASPLAPPGSSKAAGVPSAGSPSGLLLLKGSNNNTKANSSSSDALIMASPSPSRPHTAPSPLSHLTPKTPQQGPRLPLPPHSKPSPLPSLTQSNFITPMQATLTKSASTPPIIKLTHRPPNSAPAAVPPLPRSQITTTVHQYTPKTPAGFRLPFSGAQGGVGVAKPGQVGGQKPPSSSAATSTTSLTNTSSNSNKHSGSSPSPAGQTNQGQRQRVGGGATQGVKPIASVSSQSVSSQLTQVSTAGAAGGLLSSTASLPLGFGMLGGLVPVSLPFQFPSLLSLPQLGTTGSSSGASVSAASSNVAFSTLTQNLYKSLQSGSQVALPPHLQLAFSDVSQSQGGDNKRKTL